MEDKQKEQGEVKKFGDYVKVVNNSELKTSWDHKNSKDFDSIPKKDATSKNFIHLNFLRENSFDITNIQAGGNKQKFDKGCERIRVGNDFKETTVFGITISKIYTEETILDTALGYYTSDYENDDWRSVLEPNVVKEIEAMLGQPIGDETIEFNFFTSFTNIQSDSFKEQALIYAKNSVKNLLKTVGKCDRSDAYDNDKFPNYIQAFGGLFDKSSDRRIIEEVNVCAYRAYQDTSCLYDVEDLMGSGLLEDFLKL